MTGSSLDQERVERSVAGRTLFGGDGAVLEHHARLGSTNDRIKELAAEGAAEGSLVVADGQERGRGRLGRTWASPAGGLYLSLLLRPDDAMLRRLPVTLLAGLAAAEAIEAVSSLPARLKWPNDVHVNGRKVAGILGELTRDDAGPALVLGVGVNVATPAEAFGGELAGVATSLAAEGVPPDLEAVLSAFLERFERHYQAVQRGGGAHVLAAASERMPMLGQAVRVRLAERVLEGTADGLNATGGLVVRTADGGHEVVVAGEVEEVRPA